MVKQQSKMITVRLPIDLYNELHVAANGHRQSLNTWCMIKLRDAAERQRGTSSEAEPAIDAPTAETRLNACLVCGGAVLASDFVPTLRRCVKCHRKLRQRMEGPMATVERMLD